MKIELIPPLLHQPLRANVRWMHWCVSLCCADYVFGLIGVNRKFPFPAQRFPHWGPLIAFIRGNRYLLAL